MIFTRPLIALTIVLIGFALPVGVACGESPWPVDSDGEERPPDLPPWLMASRLSRPPDDVSRDDGAGGLSDLGAVLLREAPAGPIDPDPLTLRTSSEEPNDLRALLSGPERWHLMRFGAAAGSQPRQAKITAYGAVAYLSGSPAGAGPDSGLGFGPVVAPGTGSDLDDPEQPVSLGFKAQLAGLEGGAEYRSVGKRLDRVVSGPASQKDREGTEVWLAQRLGLLRLKLSESDLSDNVDRDPALPRTIKAQTALTVQLAPRDWPIFGLTYAAGDSERVWLTGEGHARAVERQTFDSVAGSAYYGGPGWDVSGSSTYALSREPGRPDRQMTMLYHDLTLTLRPADSVIVMPAVSRGLDRYEWSDTRSETGSASLLLSYTPTASRWSVWTLAAYTASQSSDRTVDGRTMSVSGGLAWGLGRILGGRTTLSIQAGYDRYVDGIYPDSSSRGVFALAFLKVASF
jgi:hypothetical protein